LQALPWAWKTPLGFLAFGAAGPSCHLHSTNKVNHAPFFFVAMGSVALTWNGHNEPSRTGHSGRETEELVHKPDFACHVALSQAAMAAADHPHHLEAFDRGGGYCLPLEAAGRPMTRLSAPCSASMMLFKYFEVRCSTSCAKWPSRCRRRIALG
jgi:hypothetical protein